MPFPPLASLAHVNPRERPLTLVISRAQNLFFRGATRADARSHASIVGTGPQRPQELKRGRGKFRCGRGRRSLMVPFAGRDGFFGAFFSFLFWSMGLVRWGEACDLARSGGSGCGWICRVVSIRRGFRHVIRPFVHSAITSPSRLNWWESVAKDETTRKQKLNQLNNLGFIQTRKREKEIAAGYLQPKTRHRHAMIRILLCDAWRTPTKTPCTTVYTVSMYRFISLAVC